MVEPRITNDKHVLSKWYCTSYRNACDAIRICTSQGPGIGSARAVLSIGTGKAQWNLLGTGSGIALTNKMHAKDRCMCF